MHLLRLDLFADTHLGEPVLLRESLTLVDLLVEFGFRLLEILERFVVFRLDLLVVLARLVLGLSRALVSVV